MGVGSLFILSKPPKTYPHLPPKCSVPMSWNILMEHWSMRISIKGVFMTPV